MPRTILVPIQQGLEAGMVAEAVPSRIDLQDRNREPGGGRKDLLQKVDDPVVFAEVGQDSGQEDLGGLVEVLEDHVQPAVAVQIGDRQAPPHPGEVQVQLPADGERRIEIDVAG